MSEVQQAFIPIDASEDLSPGRRRPKISLLTLFSLVLGVGLGILFHMRVSQELLVRYPDLKRPQLLSECSANVTRMAEAHEAFRAIHDRYPENQYQLVPEFLPKLPHCPVSGHLSYRTSYGLELCESEPLPEDYFVVECCGQNHQPAGIAPNQPRFDNVDGLSVKRLW